jgi:hypothetical protein
LIVVAARAGVQVRRWKASPVVGTMVEVLVPLGPLAGPALLSGPAAVLELPGRPPQPCSAALPEPGPLEEGPVGRQDLACSGPGRRRGGAPVPGAPCAALTCGPFPLWSRDQPATILLTANILPGAVR